MQVGGELRTAVALVFGQPTPADIDRIDVQELIMLLKRNRVPVAVLPESPILQRLRQYPEFETFFQRERERYNYALKAYSEVQAAWREANINAVLIKSPGYFPYTSDNVDILVLSAQVDQAMEILRRLGYIELPHVREPHKRLFRKIKGPYIGFPVHLHTGVAWINSFLTDTEVVSSCRRSQEDSIVVCPSAEHILMITTAHWLYEDKELKLRDLYHSFLALGDNIDWKYIWESAIQRGWYEGLRLGLLMYALAGERLHIQAFNERLPDPDKDDVPRWLTLYFRRLCRYPLIFPLRLSKVFCKGLHLRKTVKDQPLSADNKLKELYLLILFALNVKSYHLRRRRCFIVALSGPDGAGKTTLARSLQNFLGTFAIPAKYHWIRPGSSEGLEIIKFTLSWWTQSKGGRARGHKAKTQNHSNPTVYKRFLERHQCVRPLWGYVLACDLLIRLWLHLLWAKMIGGIHIFDRYAVDAAVDLATIYKFTAARWITKLSPKPDVGVLLWVDKEETPKRGTTLPSSNYLEQSLRLYQEWQDYHLRLSGCDTPDQLLEKAAGPILRTYLRDDS